MSYEAQVYLSEVKTRFEKQNDPSFFENPENLIPFSASQRKELRDRLRVYDFKKVSEENGNESFESEIEGRLFALLTDSAVYFSTDSSDTNSLFEVGMTASEFTDTGEFAKFDPQTGAWESFD